MTENAINSNDIITAISLKNAIDLSFAIVLKCAGNDISNQIGGESIELTTVLDDLIASTISSTIANKI